MNYTKSSSNHASVLYWVALYCSGGDIPNFGGNVRPEITDQQKAAVWLGLGKHSTVFLRDPTQYTGVFKATIQRYFMLELSDSPYKLQMDSDFSNQDKQAWVYFA